VFPVFKHLTHNKKTHGRANQPNRAPLVPDLLFGEVGVDLNKALPLIRDFVFHEDRVHRALRLAQAAVNALIRINVKLIACFMDAVHGADRNAGSIFDANAGFGDYIRHVSVPPHSNENVF